MNNRKPDLTQCVGRLECGEERGSAFFLAADLAITCRHCILPHFLGGEGIVIHVGADSIAADVAEPRIPDAHDVVLLRLRAPVSEDRLFPLYPSFLPYGASWETFGFPHVRARQGMGIQGFVARSLESDYVPRDVELTCSLPDMPTNFGGFSGSPVVMGGVARAVLQTRLDGGLGAISLAGLRSYLEEAGVHLSSATNPGPLPGSLSHELKESVPNRRTLWRLEETLAEGKPGYVILSGHPGSGKTLLIAGFQPSAEMRVVARYFASSYAGSEVGAAHHGRIATFAQWLSNVAALASPAAAARADSTTEQFSESIAANLTALGKTATEGSGFGVLLIDGVEPGDTAATEFIPYLPSVPPPGLAIVLSTVNVESFKAKFHHIRIAEQVDTSPLTQHDCERLVVRRLAGRILPSQAARVAELSQGHPLTLAYLIKDVEVALDRGEPDPLPSLRSWQGGLAGYYEGVWVRLSGQGVSQYIVALVARLRQSVTKEQLTRILPEVQQPAFLDSFGRVRHLLGSEEGTVSLYHQSFHEFVIARSEPLDEQIHRQIAQYCESEPTAEYAVANVLYHRMAGGQNPLEISRLCTQEWADRAALACVHPETLLSDIDAILKGRLRAGDVNETVRLLLLRSRMESQYNRVFARHATGFCRAAITTRSAGQALRFLFREGHYLGNSRETLAILRTLSLVGRDAEAQRLYQEFRARCWAAYEKGEASFGLLFDHLRATCVAASSFGREDIDFVVREIRNLLGLMQANRSTGERSDAADDALRANAGGAMLAEHLWRSGFAPCNPNDPVELAFTLDEARRIAWEHGYQQPLESRPETSAVPGLRPALSRQEIADALKAGVSDVAPVAASVVARNLLRVSGSFARVGELYRLAVPGAAEVSLRQENGVDPELSSIDDVQFFNEVRAFTDDILLDGRITFATRHEWEHRIFESAEWLGRVRGKLFRARALQETPPEALISRMEKEFIPRLRFTLLERSRWEDAYHLPEHAVPRLMHFAAQAVAELEPASSGEFVDLLLAHPDGQMGLYSEGYRRLLEAVANVLGSTPEGKVPASDVRRKLRTHIVKRVFPRDARVEGLLDCAQHFAALGAPADAENAYEEAIRSSLGPAWYKQDQFRLLLDAVEAVDDTEFSRSQWRKTVEILAIASGESTFQRYVRQQKDRLVRHLATRGLLAEALATYRHYVVPSFRLQRSRVQRVGIDMTSGLSGDRFGVLEIDEQYGALSLLAGTENASLLKRWAVLELFWPWGDTRHSLDFVEAFHALTGAGQTDAIRDRFVRFLGTEVEPSRREEFLLAVESGAPPVVLAWTQLAREAGLRVPAAPPGPHIPEAAVPSDRPPGDDDGGEEDDGLFTPGLFGRKRALVPLKDAPLKAKRRIDREDVDTARGILVGALREAQQGEWDIWEGGLRDAEEALEILFAQCGPPELALRSLAEVVLSERYASSWRVAERLVLASVRHLSQGGRLELFSLLTEHVECLIRAERGQLSIADELAELPQQPGEITADECLDGLLLSSLDHPSPAMRERAADIIRWLALQSAISTDALVNLAASDGPCEGREVAVGILQHLAASGGSFRSQTLAAPGFDRLVKANHFLARLLVEELGGTWQGSGGPPPSAVPPEYEWSFDPAPILNLHPGAREIADRILPGLCAPLTGSEVRELSHIRHMAFGLEAPHQGYGFEREAIFRALAGVSDDSVRAGVLAFVTWNPQWPDADLRLSHRALVPSILSSLESGNCGSAFVVGDRTILHCAEFVPPARGDSVAITEVVAVLIPEAFFRGELNYDELWEARSAHQREIAPLSVSTIALPQEPAVARFDPGPTVGGFFTPAQPSRLLRELVGTAAVERVCWRNGRRWDVWCAGPPLARGTATLIETASLSRLSGYRLVWVVLRNEQPIAFADPRKNQVRRLTHDDLNKHGSP